MERSAALHPFVHNDLPVHLTGLLMMITFVQFSYRRESDDISSC